jgi:hypothetical protein
LIAPALVWADKAIQIRRQSKDRAERGPTPELVAEART